MNELEKKNEVKKGKGILIFILGVVLGAVLMLLASEIYTKEMAPIDMRDYENTDILIASNEGANTSFNRFHYTPDLPNTDERFFQETEFKDDEMLISGELFS